MASDFIRVRSALTVLGGLWAAYQAYKIASFVHLHFLHRNTLDRYKKSKDGQGETSWALVTGATDGIGRGFAEELCSRGFNVVLHGRNQQKLEAVKMALNEKSPNAQVRTLRIDASKEADDAEAFNRAAAALKDIDLRILINNVGGTGGELNFMPLQDRTSDSVGTIMDVNARFPTQITRALLPQLRKNAPGLIMNIGSITSDLGIPYLDIYSGCKAYNKGWSRALTAEMKAEGKDIEVMCIMVATVATDYTPRAASIFVATARQMARESLYKVGCGRSIVYGYWAHHLQTVMVSLLPEWLLEKFLIQVGKQEKVADEQRAAKRN